MKMHTKTAYKIGIEAIRRYRRDFAFNAGLYDIGVRAICTERDRKKYDLLTLATEILQKESEK